MYIYKYQVPICSFIKLSFVHGCKPIRLNKRNSNDSKHAYIRQRHISYYINQILVNMVYRLIPSEIDYLSMIKK